MLINLGSVRELRWNMKIGDAVWIRGIVDEIRKDTVIIKNKGGYFGTDPCEVVGVPDRNVGDILIKCKDFSAK